MYAAILILASFGAGPAFTPSPEFLLQQWQSMPQNTPRERIEREQTRKLWVAEVRKQNARMAAMERKQRVAAKNASGIYFRRQQEGHEFVARSLEAMQPKQWWFIP